MNGLAVCAGIEGLGLGLSLAIPSYRTVCAVEIEAAAVAILVARQQDGSLPPFPIWDDLSTFDGEPWRGIIHIVHAGLPCQPYSVAGKRQGHADERAIWPAFMRLVGTVRPALVFLENVPGFLAYFRPVGEELSRLGYEYKGGIFSAAEIGASHRRERLFILAHRIIPGIGRGDQSGPGTSWGETQKPEDGQDTPDQLGDRGQDVAHREGGGLREGRNDEQGWQPYALGSGGTVTDPAKRQSRVEAEPQGRQGAERGGEELAHAEGDGAGGHETSKEHDGPTSHRGRSDGRFDGLPAWPPPPHALVAWRDILAKWPELAPAVEDASVQRGRGGHDGDTSRQERAPETGGPDGEPEAVESSVRSLASRTPSGLDIHRTDQLRSLGNMVVPIQAAFAFITLAKRLNPMI